MRVKVVESTSQQETVTVRFSSEFGEATASWIGACPPTNTEHDVEFSIAEPIFIWQRNEGAKDKTDLIEMTHDGVRICAKVDGVDADGLVALRLRDSLIQVESRGPTPPIGIHVCIVVKAITLFPYNI